MLPHLNLDVRDDQRLFFVTDIHGCILSMDVALDMCGFKVCQDVVVCAGDLIDRGPHNLKTAFRFINDKTGSYYSVIGNHDQFAIKQDWENWFSNGGKWIIDEGFTHDEMAEFGQSLAKLPYLITVNYHGRSIGVVHAAVPYDCESWDQLVQSVESENWSVINSMIWDRDFVEYWDNPHYKNKIVYGVDFTVHGHTIIPRANFLSNRLHLDTGLVRGKALSLAEVIPANNTIVIKAFRQDDIGEMYLDKTETFCLNTYKSLGIVKNKIKGKPLFL